MLPKRTPSFFHCDRTLLRTAKVVPMNTSVMPILSSHAKLQECRMRYLLRAKLPSNLVGIPNVVRGVFCKTEFLTRRNRAMHYWHCKCNKEIFTSTFCHPHSSAFQIEGAAGSFCPLLEGPGLRNITSNFNFTEDLFSILAQQRWFLYSKLPIGIQKSCAF